VALVAIAVATTARAENLQIATVASAVERLAPAAPEPAAYTAARAWGAGWTDWFSANRDKVKTFLECAAVGVQVATIVAGVSVGAGGLLVLAISAGLCVLS